MIALIIFLLLMTVAHAEENKVIHENEIMKLVTQPDGSIEISYIILPTIVRESGAAPGQVLVQGKWNKDVLEGEAFAFSQGCGPISYPIRGIVSQTGTLIVVGPMPTSCLDKTLIWKEGSVMTFDQPRVPKRQEERKKQVEKVVKPKPKPRQQQQAQPQPYRQQWDWRGFGW